MGRAKVVYLAIQFVQKEQQSEVRIFALMEVANGLDGKTRQSDPRSSGGNVGRCMGVVIKYEGLCITHKCPPEIIHHRQGT